MFVARGCFKSFSGRDLRQPWTVYPTMPYHAPPRLLGFAAPHALREWLQHEGLVVEAGKSPRVGSGWYLWCGYLTWQYRTMGVWMWHIKPQVILFLFHHVASPWFKDAQVGFHTSSWPDSMNLLCDNVGPWVGTTLTAAGFSSSAGWPCSGFGWCHFSMAGARSRPQGQGAGCMCGVGSLETRYVWSF